VAVVALAAGALAYVFASRPSQRESDPSSRRDAPLVVAPSLASAPPSPSTKETRSAAGDEAAAGAPGSSTEAAKEFKVPVRLRYASGAPVVGEVVVTLELEEDDDVYTSSTAAGPAFEIDVERPGVYEVSHLEVANEPYEPLPADVDLRPGSTIEWTLDLPRSAVLQVVDAGTRTPVAGARAYRHVRETKDDPHFETPIQVPWPVTLRGTPVLGDTGGKVVLPALWHRSSWYVVAPGRAWASVEASHREEPTVVELSPGGSLRLHVSRWTELDMANVDAQWGLDGAAFGAPGAAEAAEGRETLLLELPRPDAQGNLEVEGLPVGDCGIGVRRGKWFNKGEIYGSGRVSIRAGETSSLSIDVSDEAIRARAPFRVRVRVPAAWSAKAIRLHLEGNDEQTAGTLEFTSHELSADGSGEADLGPLPQGTYEISVWPMGWSTRVQSPAASPPVLDVPPPVDVEVRVLDDRTARPLERAAVQWSFVLPGDRGWSPTDATFDAARGVHTFRAPRGTIRVSVEAIDYVPTMFEKEAAEGMERPLELRVDRDTILLVRARLEGAPVAGGFRALAKFVDPEDGEPFTEEGEGEAEKRFSLWEGTFEISIVGLEDAAPAPPKSVTLREGEKTEVVFDLERKR
jgi:hypothetical protein